MAIKYSEICRKYHNLEKGNVDHILEYMWHRHSIAHNKITMSKCFHLIVLYFILYCRLIWIFLNCFSGLIYVFQNNIVSVDERFCLLYIGLLEDATGSWTSSFYFVGILSALAVVLCLLERPISHIWCCHRIVADDIIDVSRDIVDKSIPVAYKFNG